MMTGEQAEAMEVSYNYSDEKNQYSVDVVAQWDDLIAWKKRKESENRFFEKILRENSVATVLDAATGTGYHSINLLKAGFDVTSVDASEEMLAQAIVNGKNHGTSLKTIRSDWRQLTDHVEGKYDAVICLGSSFPHLFEESDRIKALKEFRRVMNNGGILIIDHRNFDSILTGRYKSNGNYHYCGRDVNVSVHEANSKLVRFEYDFSNGNNFFLEVYPLLIDEAASLFKRTGFELTADFGDFNSDYDVHQTDFITHIVKKTA